MSSAWWVIGAAGLVATVLAVLALAFLRVRQRDDTRHARTGVSSFFGAKPPEPVLKPHYRADTVGNDAAARPWDRQAPDAADWQDSRAGVLRAPQRAPQVGASAGTRDAPSSLAFRPDQLPDRLPAHFDLEACMAQSRQHFETLHAAWESANMAQLAPLLSPQLRATVQSALAQGQLPGWGEASSTVAHISARVLDAKPPTHLDTDLPARAQEVRVAFSGLQTDRHSGASRAIAETWLVLSDPPSGLWQVRDLHSAQA